jgi:hypothetical protein
MKIEAMEEDLSRAAARLRTMCDEARVDAHLARMDARDEWQRFKGRLPTLRRLAGEIEQSLEELYDAAGKVTLP